MRPAAQGVGLGLRLHPQPGGLVRGLGLHPVGLGAHRGALAGDLLLALHQIRFPTGDELVQLGGAHDEGLLGLVPVALGGLARLLHEVGRLTYGATAQLGRLALGQLQQFLRPRAESLFLGGGPLLRHRFLQATVLGLHRFDGLGGVAQLAFRFGQHGAHLLRRLLLPEDEVVDLLPVVTAQCGLESGNGVVRGLVARLRAAFPASTEPGPGLPDDTGAIGVRTGRVLGLRPTG
jgi:hypothetical protein